MVEFKQGNENEVRQEHEVLSSSGARKDWWQDLLSFCPAIFLTEIDMPTYCYSDLLYTAEEDPRIETTCTLLQWLLYMWFRSSIL